MKVAFTRRRLATRLGQLGRTISRDYAGRTLDIVIVLENSFLFGSRFGARDFEARGLPLRALGHARR